STWFYKQFMVPTDLTSSYLTITSDGRYTVYVNGKKIAKDVGGWRRAEKYNIAKLLHKAQNNTIEVYVSDHAPKNAGLLVDLTYKTENKQLTHILSDSTWQVSNIKPANWPEITGSDHWLAAKVVAA